MTDPDVRALVVDRLRAAGCVFAEDEAELLLAHARETGDLDALVHRRVRGEPLERILGWAEFCGLRIGIDPGVFVPRRRTELLVLTALPFLAAGRVAVDLCCGSGAVGAALAARVPGIELYAADVDPVCVRCARRNLAGVATVVEGDLDAPLPRDLLGRVDVLVANAPYVPSGSIAFMPPEARSHEPLVALDGGVDGLDVQRRVAAIAPRWLAPGGHLLVETSERQAAESAAIMAAHGLSTRVVHSADLDGTVVVGTSRSGGPADR